MTDAPDLQLGTLKKIIGALFIYLLLPNCEGLHSEFIIDCAHLYVLEQNATEKFRFVNAHNLYMQQTVYKNNN